MTISITLIGGPTALIEIDGFRLLTDPTFDASGTTYQLPYVKLEKLEGPAIGVEALGEIDAVLLSHDQHSDNLDNSGKDFLAKAKRVLTTEAGAKRLGGHAEGFAPWASTELKGKGGASLTITATPARHGPAGIEPLSGDVIGFVVAPSKGRPIYISGDTTWFDGVAEVARRFSCGVVLPFAGSAQTRGPFHLTMDTNDTIETARAFPDAVIVPVHTDGWAHFRQNAQDLRVSFDALGFGKRLKILQPGVKTVIEG